MLCYAGIGNRTITKIESELIIEIAKELASKEAIVYSGNAKGSDIAFQTGSNGKCVLMLPWKNFNAKEYDVSKSLAFFDVGSTEEGNDSVDKFHPSPQRLSRDSKRLIARNYHQVSGYANYPEVAFVACCADETADGEVLGGTGQACRIAKHNGIPVFNLRKDSEQALKDIRSVVGNYWFMNSPPRGKEIW